MGKKNAGKGRSSPAVRAASEYLAVAVAKKWSIEQLAERADVSTATARKLLLGHSRSTQQKITAVQDRRITVARQAQEAALSRLPELQDLVDRAKNLLAASLPAPGETTIQDEFGSPVPVDTQAVIKNTQGLIRASKDLHSYMEQATGMDVVKAVAVRAQTQGTGPVTSWDGVGALEVEVEKIPMLGEGEPEEEPSEEDDWI